MVKVELSDTILWNVCNFGREIRADWLVIQKCLTESNEFAKTILCLPQLSISSQSCTKYGITYSIAKLSLEDRSIFLRPFLSNSRVDLA